MRYKKQDTDSQEKYYSIKEEEYELNKETRDKSVLAGYLRHPKL
jgi:hypothetical protein